MHAPAQQPEVLGHRGHTYFSMAGHFGATSALQEKACASFGSGPEGVRTFTPGKWGEPAADKLVASQWEGATFATEEIVETTPHELPVPPWEPEEQVLRKQVAGLGLAIETLLLELRGVPPYSQEKFIYEAQPHRMQALQAELDLGRQACWQAGHGTQQMWTHVASDKATRSSTTATSHVGLMEFQPNRSKVASQVVPGGAG